MKKLINKIIRSGVKPGYAPWEAQLTRTMNAIILIAIPNMTTGILFFSIMGYSQFLPNVEIGLASLFVCLFLNIYKSYVWGFYWFFCYALGVFIISFNIKMGMESYMMVFYFPIIISMVLLLGRKETLKHLIILSGIAMLSITATGIFYKLNIFHPDLTKEVATNLATFNIILCGVVTLTFTIIIASGSIRREEYIRRLLREKDLLLNEVHHRVKNNMAVISSLLNMKIESSQSPETKEALEECKNRIYSMALLHKNIYANSTLKEINLQEYISELAKEVVSTYTYNNTIQLNIDAIDSFLNIDEAIPCGFIINELLTNSLKYALVKGKVLELHITMKLVGKSIELAYSDNGPGMVETNIRNRTSLGLTLIDMLCTQLGATRKVRNINGFIFEMKFALPKN